MKVLVSGITAGSDFLLATPALRALKLAGKGTALSLLAGRSLQEFVTGNPHLDRIFYFDGRRIFPGGFLGKAAEVLKMSWRLRREKFDLGFNFHRDWRFNIILFLAGCKKRIGFARRRRSLFLTDAPRVDGGKHHVFQYCDLLKGLGIVCLDFKLEFPLATADLAAAAEKFLMAESQGDYVVLAMGGAVAVKEKKRDRCWPGEHYAALAGMLIQDGQPVVLLGGNILAASPIQALYPEVNDWTGRTTLAEAAAIMKRARLVVCDDAELMQLAAAVGARIISIFGPTAPEARKPLAAGSVAVWKGEDLACAPCCRDNESPRCDHLSCLNEITPQEIFDLSKTF